MTPRLELSYKADGPTKEYVIDCYITWLTIAVFSSLGTVLLANLKVITVFLEVNFVFPHQVQNLLNFYVQWAAFMVAMGLGLVALVYLFKAYFLIGYKLGTSKILWTLNYLAVISALSALVMTGVSDTGWCTYPKCLPEDFIGIQWWRGLPLLFPVFVSSMMLVFWHEDEHADD